MKILVVSDLHRRKSNFERVLEKHKDIINVIFLGDGVKDAEEISGFFAQKRFFLLSGNCDFLSLLPSSKIITLAGVDILATHGHTYRVKNGTERLYEAAKIRGVKLALYGHTHIPKIEYKDGIYMVCPGALGNSSEGPAYAIIDLDEKGIMPNILKL